MKNILIVTYYFEPYNIIASRRPTSWAKYLSRDLNVTVLTRNWTGNENGLNDICIENSGSSIDTINEQLTVIRIPYKQYPSSLKKINIVPQKIRNHYNHYFGKFRDIDFIPENFENKLSEILAKKKIDLVIYSCNPYQFLNIAKRIFKQTGIKYIIDFRDVLSATMLKLSPTPKEKIYQKIMSWRLKSLIADAAALITVSDPLNCILSRNFKGSVFTIYNGFEEKLFDEEPNIEENAEIFEISYTGNLSPEMDIEIFLAGAVQFFKRCKPKAMINFIGVSDHYKRMLNKYNAELKLNVVGWLPYNEALYFLKRSSLLIYMGWKGYTGILSGKIFDYLGSKKTILLAPSDNDVIAQLLDHTNAGSVANSEQEVAEILERYYKEWVVAGSVDYKGDNNKVNEFTRENQAQKVAGIINEIFQ